MAERFDVIVLAPHAPGAKRVERFGPIEVRRFAYFFENLQTLAYNGGILSNLKRQPMNYLLTPLFVLSELLYLTRLLRSRKIDVIHAHWLIPQGAVALLARCLAGRRPAVVCTSHGSDLFGLSGKPFTKIKREIIRRCDRITVVSNAMRTYASRIGGRQDIDVLSMGVDLRHRFVPSLDTPRQAHQILFAGRLVEEKGVRYAILAMPAIVKAYPHAELHVAGDGPERRELEALAARSGVAGHVVFLGALDPASLRERYCQATVFVVPSLQEGLGLVLIEALGCECAVIATDLPAIADVIIDGVTGRICRQKDSEDLAEKIIALLADAPLRTALARAGRQHVLARYDWHHVARRYGALIADLP